MLAGRSTEIVPMSSKAVEVEVTEKIKVDEPTKNHTVENPIEDGIIARKEVTSMQVPVITLTRKQLYDEIWEISVMGVSKKYDIPYPQMLMQVKKAAIPIPPSGYWTKISFGKPVVKTAFTGVADEPVELYKEFSVTKERANKNEIKKEPIHPASASKAMETEPQHKEPTLEEKPTNALAIQSEKPQTMEQYGQTYNVYDREVLYEEVWKAPVTEVAKKYLVSDVAIHKVCKSLDIPTPPLGYWAKLRAGKSVTKTPLPKSDKTSKKTGIQTGYTPSAAKKAEAALDFLDENERLVVLAVASQILLPDENERMHSAIIAHRKVIAEWEKHKLPEDATRFQRRNAPKPPYLVGTVSDNSIPRACRIIDALIKAMEPLGCKLTQQLDFVVNGETVGIGFSESQDQVNHVLTREENRQLLLYEERRKKYSYESKPQIRKYDHKYNGRLSCTISGEKSFRDCKSYQLEDRLGDMLIELYIAAEKLKQQRLAREKAERTRKEEAARKEERRKRYNKEVDKTIALANEAKDYNTACQIRAYIAAYETVHKEENISEWVSWANAKADWYDPTISRKDELLGERDHGEDEEEKKPKHAGYYW